MKRIAILGSTGSIGRSALAVVDAHPDRLQVVDCGPARTPACSGQMVRYRPRVAAMASGAALDRLKPSVRPAASPVSAATAWSPWLRDVDLVLCASSGTDGLEAVLAAIAHRKTIALANKEVLVMAGGIVTEAARCHDVAILPVDSEHNAIHQCLHGRPPSEVKRLVLTASGGPFRGRASSELLAVSAEDALKHPTWRMGRKITIDSATLMNKGLEVIEAHWLFGVGADQIDVVVLAVRRPFDGRADRRFDHRAARGHGHAAPDSVCVSYPERWLRRRCHRSGVACRAPRFRPAGPRHSPSWPAYRALECGCSLPVVLNAANEIAVARFLAGASAFRRSRR
jgi:1-deoxy-D-xylulose-5-phosphate reductoisomerase